VRDYLSVADLLLLPSQTESFGLTALEAMACEVPVIATRVGGIPELVEDEGCGYLFEIGDVDAMAAAARRVLSDDAERERLGRRGREIAVTRFTTDKIIPQYEALYRRVVQRGDSRV
jgi:glycosyltransferase involved in cell wall biosynthesis